MHPKCAYTHVEGATPDTLLAFVSSAAHDPDNGAERPTKRRCPDNPERSEQTSHSGVTPPVSVVILRRQLSIVFADRNVSTCPLEESIQWRDDCKIPVILEWSHRDLVRQKIHLTVKSTTRRILVDTWSDFKGPRYIWLDLVAAIDVKTSPEGKKEDWHRSEVARSEFLLAPPRAGERGIFTIQFQVVWRTATSLADGILPSSSEKLHEILDRAFPQADSLKYAASSPQRFYDAAHLPGKDQKTTATMQIDQLRCQLYPFQQRAVRWLLRREGVDMNFQGTLQVYDPPRNDSLPLSFTPQIDEDGQRCYVSCLYGMVATKVAGFSSPTKDLLGGILAEEMGLGKSVELIALICLHQRGLVIPNPAPEPATDEFIAAARTTLIVTPLAILQQWMREFEEHAPTLKVFHYQGLRSKAGRAGHDELVQTLMDHDVVVTTYNVLRSEVHYTNSVRNRQLRHEKKWYSQRSASSFEILAHATPEAQMVESGLSNAAIIARMIPRRNAWAITGTPVRKDARDLLGLLNFLHFGPFCQLPFLFDTLVFFFPSLFREVFGQIALRHNKDQVRGELHIPLQKRMIITVPFLPVEQQHYSQLFENMCEACGLTSDGGPAAEDWDPKCPAVIEQMRTWLTRLRQTCLHPEVGVRNRRSLGLNGTQPLRTVSEVLEAMIEQNDLLIRSEQRNLLLMKFRRGQLREKQGEVLQAIEIWYETLKQARNIIQECQDQVIGDFQRIKAQIIGADPDFAEFYAKNQGPTSISDEKSTLVSPASAKGADHEHEDEEESSKHEESLEDREIWNRYDNLVAACGQKTRATMEIQHRCFFFIANGYYQLRSSSGLILESEHYKTMEKLENGMYEQARLKRKKILSEVNQRAQKLMTRVAHKAREQAFVEIPEMGTVQEIGGLESRNVQEKLELLTRALNDQANQLDEWREKVIELLICPLVDEEGTTDIRGDEYDESTKTQDELYVYMEALQVVVADRHDALTGDRNRLVRENVKRLKRLAESGEGHQPELLKRLFFIREKIKPSEDIGSLRGILSTLRHLTVTLRWQAGQENARIRLELAVIEKLFENAQKLSAEQVKVDAALERELDLFRDTQNARLEYYKQLQQISDAVAPLEDLHEDPVLLEDFVRAHESRTSKKIASLKAKARYLVHLRAESGDKEAGNICVICQQAFEDGVMTICGHEFCKECIEIWWAVHRSCALCKRHLCQNEIHLTTYQRKEATVHEEVHDVEEKNKSNALEKSPLYSNVSNETLAEIKRINLDGSFSTKIDMIARHILWLRKNDYGAKAIIFSQFPEFLEVLARAFRQFNIRFTGIDNKNGVQDFKDDPKVEVFLLHAKAQSSGLNLVVATHVFLCEPLINTALELQAIARVHRIGQRRPTTVWMYLINDTVEESIYEISVARRMAHIRSSVKEKEMTTATANEADVTMEDADIDAANSLELQQASSATMLSTNASGGGEMVDNADLWSCLFNARKKKRNSNSRSRSRVASQAPSVLSVPSTSEG